MATDAYEETLYGQILPLEWEDDRVSEVALFVDSEEEFVIETHGLGKKLLDLVDRWVTIDGVVEERGEELRLKVRDFKVDKEFEYSFEDEW